LWKKIGNKISLPLLITFYLFFIEAFFFTLAPLYADNLEQIKFGGFFLAAYSLPVLLSGLVVGKIVSKFGKIKTARFCLLIGSTIISTFMLVHNPYISIIIVIAASFFFGISFPSINGIYADLISETPLLEGEIETWEDFSFNIGYILGPITAGFLSDIFSIPAAFSILGIVGIIISVALIISKQFRICIR
jgi:MFS family permease